MKKQTLNQMVMVRMTPDLRRKLEALAEKDRRPLAEICRIILEDHVKAKSIRAERK